MDHPPFNLAQRQPIIFSGRAVFSEATPDLHIAQIQVSGGRNGLTEPIKSAGLLQVGRPLALGSQEMPCHPVPDYLFHGWSEA